MTISEIEKLYKKFKVPRNIIAHMEKVKEVAVILGENMKKKGKKIDLDLIEKAALMHDLLKVHDNHAIKMANMLRKKEKSELANLIEKHDFPEVERLETWEEKIIYYADKRVLDDKVVSLEKRFKEGRKRHKVSATEKTKNLEKKVFKLEKELISELGKLPI